MDSPLKDIVLYEYENHVTLKEFQKIERIDEYSCI